MEREGPGEVVHVESEAIDVEQRQGVGGLILAQNQIVTRLSIERNDVFNQKRLQSDRDRDENIERERQGRFAIDAGQAVSPYARSDVRLNEPPRVAKDKLDGLLVHRSVGRDRRRRIQYVGSVEIEIRESIREHGAQVPVERVAGG